MTITYLVGDATAPGRRPAVIAHVANDAGKWGRGFVLAVSARWPQPELVYRLKHRQEGHQLRDVQFVDVADGLWVANMVAQHGIGPSRDGTPPIRLGALLSCLQTVADFAEERGAAIVMPRIGCGLAGARWHQVEPLIEQACARVPVCIYDLTDSVAR